MRTIIAGSRGITKMKFVQDAMNEAWEQEGISATSIVSGTAAGVDTLAIKFADAYNLPCAKFPADWNTHGKSAGYKRNVVMAENADALVAIWDGESRGTQHMINIARARGLKVYVKTV